jgi:hypothetical protein
MSTNISSLSSTQSPLVGKYLYVDKLEFDPYGESWGYECYCLSFNNNIYTVQNKFGKEYKATINQITKVIDITEYQKFRVGDIVEAKVTYCQNDGDWQTEYCQVISVKNFANDYDYVLKNVGNSQTYNISQKSIIKTITLMQGKYQLGMYVGVKHTIGPQWDEDTIIKNGTIIKVNQCYNRVTYDIKYDFDEADNTQNVYENQIIVAEVRKVYKTPEQIKENELEFLRTEEQRLLQQLEMVRAARLLAQ